jgi:hypothetical protein
MDDDAHVDGNAAAGQLAEIFAFDVTTAHAVCGGCGADLPVGRLTAYGLEMGAILRCPGCDTAMMRVSRVRSGYWLDLRGISVLRVPVVTGNEPP